MEQDYDIKAREKAFHDQRFAQDKDPRAGLDKFYAITAESNAYYREAIARIMQPGKRLLEYGCGTGGDLAFFHAIGCDLHGIDISKEAVIKAEKQAQDAGIPAQYVVGDAEATGFAAQHFQAVVGSGILHHLNLDRSMAELSRITAPGGACVFSEPLGHNPLINLFRRVTPTMRTPDEHPLLTSDFALMRKYFKTVDVKYFYLFSIGAAFFKKTPIFVPIKRILHAMDTALISSIPGLGKHAWLCIIELRDPITPGAA